MLLVVPQVPKERKENKKERRERERQRDIDTERFVLISQFGDTPVVGACHLN